MPRTIIVGWVCSLLIACGVEFKVTDLSGFWAGAYPDGESEVYWAAERSESGAFKIAFEVRNNNGTVDLQRDFGVWDFEDGVYRTTTVAWAGRAETMKAVDKAKCTGAVAKTYDVSRFEVAEVEYRSRKSGRIHVAKRVPPEVILQYFPEEATQVVDQMVDEIFEACVI